jgi:hypothetical protein
MLKVLGYYNIAKYQKDGMMSIKKGQEKEIGSETASGAARGALRHGGGRKKGLT